MNVLATLVLVYGGLTVGRQVLQWWGEKPQPPGGRKQIEAPGGLGDLGRSHVIQAGTLPVELRRQEIEGDVKAAFAALRASCRDIAEHPQPITDEPRLAELALLESIAQAKPVEEEPGKWQLYQLEGPMALVVATADVPAGKVPAETPGGDVPNVAGAKRRVVCWGLAVRLSGTRWTLFTLQAGGHGASAPAGLPPLPIPPGCERTLALGAVGGDAIIGFQGRTAPADCRKALDRWFADQGWTAPTDWQQLGPAWQRRYQQAQGYQIDIQLEGTAGEVTRGLFVVSAPPSAARGE